MRELRYVFIQVVIRDQNPTDRRQPPNDLETDGHSS